MIYPQVNAVIEILSVPNIRFDMNFPLECIGGHCVKSLSPNKHIRVIAGFAKVSGIEDQIIGDMVCFPHGNKKYYTTVAQAIKMLEHLRDYGIVDWDRAIRNNNDQG